MNHSIFPQIISPTLTTSLLLSLNIIAASPAYGETETPLLKDEFILSIDFALPNDTVPQTNIGGGVRGNVQFALPDSATPSTNIGGGVRGNVNFALPDSATPSTNIGGGVRGNVNFALPGSAAPTTSVGAGVRGDVNFALPDSAAPSTSVGAGVRGNVNFALPGSAAPTTNVGAGVRGDINFQLPGSAAPTTNVGAGVRGEVEFALPGREAPTTNVGAGVRGANIPLTAIVPPTKLGLTASERPTIFVYLPPIGAERIFFSIRDEDDNPHYQAYLPVSPGGGVISITLPENTPPLTLEKNYLWYFAPIEPGGFLRPDSYSVVGWVKRVTTNIEADAFAASPVELATEYGKEGIWYDTLATIVNARRSDPTNETFATEWRDLLANFEALKEIAERPFGDQF